MAKFSRFMIAQNPMAEPGAEYVLHTQKPRFLAKKLVDNPVTDFDVIDDIDNIAAFYNHDLIKAAGLMRRLGDWYLSYCKFKERTK